MNPICVIIIIKMICGSDRKANPMVERKIQKVVRKVSMDEAGNDFEYWQSRPYIERLAALEEIRREYIKWKYCADPGFQRVVNFKKLDDGPDN
jgi:hypothetical protein